MRHASIFIILFVLGLLAYGPSLGNPFLLDDRMLFDASIRAPSGIIQQFDPAQQKFCYRPMLGVALNVCYQFFGAHTWGYHVFNLFLLCGGAFFLYLLLLCNYENRIFAVVAAVLFLL